jgi:hypothetical protein
MNDEPITLSADFRYEGEVTDSSLWEWLLGNTDTPVLKLHPSSK